MPPLEKLKICPTMFRVDISRSKGLLHGFVLEEEADREGKGECVAPRWPAGAEEGMDVVPRLI